MMQEEITQVSSSINWTVVITAGMSLLGTIASGLFAYLSGRKANLASRHADRAIAASLRPRPSIVDVEPPPLAPYYPSTDD